MTDQITIQLIIAVTTYCSGPGKQVEGGWIGEKNCFRKVWVCGHKVSHPMSIVSETHNCIGKHIRGELKELVP